MDPQIDKERKPNSREYYPSVLLLENIRSLLDNSHAQRMNCGKASSPVEIQGNGNRYASARRTATEKRISNRVGGTEEKEGSNVDHG